MVQTDGEAQRQDHTRHRLEAFSDIVIAFSLSQLAFTLQIPHDSGELRFARWVAFLGSFALVCAFWWLHHKLFERFFVPDVPSVILNFAFLACTVLVVYSQQLMLHFDSLPRAYAAYALSFGCAYGLLAILYAKGLRNPRVELDDEARRYGVRRATRLAIVSGGLLVSVVLALLNYSVTVITAAWIAIPVVILAQRLLEKITQKNKASV